MSVSTTSLLAFTVAVALAIPLAAGHAPPAPSGVQNPKELTAPVKLVAVDIILDGGQSVCGKLRGSNGKEFWFFLGWGPNVFGRQELEGLHVGYINGHIPDSSRAKFEGWTERDFWLLMEQTIRDAFWWDARSERLVAKDPNAFDSPSQAQSFGRTAARRLLRRAESILKRRHSYMEPRKT